MPVFGIPDLIANLEGYIEVLFGNGDGTFRSGPNALLVQYSPEFVATELNGNGISDLVLSDGNGIAVSLGNGDGTFQGAVIYQVADGVYGITVGDFNNDGILDGGAVLVDTRSIPPFRI